MRAEILSELVVLNLCSGRNLGPLAEPQTSGVYGSVWEAATFRRRGVSGDQTE